MDHRLERTSVLSAIRYRNMQSPIVVLPALYYDYRYCKQIEGDY